MSRPCSPPPSPNGDIVVIDNLPAHKGDGVRAAIERTGSILAPAALLPDHDPIEMAFAKLRALLRKAAARTQAQLWDPIGEVLGAFTPDECANYLAHAGYAAP